VVIQSRESGIGRVFFENFQWLRRVELSRSLYVNGLWAIERLRERIKLTKRWVWNAPLIRQLGG
jgi:hypothetical protein